MKAIFCRKIIKNIRRNNLKLHIIIEDIFYIKFLKNVIKLNLLYLLTNVSHNFAGGELNFLGLIQISEETLQDHLMNYAGIEKNTVKILWENAICH